MQCIIRSASFSDCAWAHQADHAPCYYANAWSEEVSMTTAGMVTIRRGGKTYAATYTVEHGMVHVKTHTETRSVALGEGNPDQIARDVLIEIVNAARPSK